MWDSSLELVRPLTGQHLCSLPLGFDIAVLSMSVVNKKFVVVGGSEALSVTTRLGRRFMLKVFAVEQEGQNEPTLRFRLEFQLEGFPSALCDHHGRLVVATGSLVRIYEVTDEALLRVDGFSAFPTSSPISRIVSKEDRLFVGHATESVSVLRVRERSHTMELLAYDSSAPRFVSALACLNHSLVCGGDVFGNIFILNVPDSAEDGLASRANGKSPRMPKTQMSSSSSSRR